MNIQEFFEEKSSARLPTTIFCDTNKNLLIYAANNKYYRDLYSNEN